MSESREFQNGDVRGRKLPQETSWEDFSNLPAVSQSTNEGKPKGLMVCKANSSESTENGVDTIKNENHRYDLLTVQFADFLHSTQFVKLIQSIDAEANHFVFESRPESRNLKFICKLCDKSFMESKAAAAHIKAKQHASKSASLNFMTSNIQVLKNCAFLKPQTTRKSFLCKCCEVSLPSEVDAWIDHFQSESHKEKSGELVESDIDLNALPTVAKSEDAPAVNHVADVLADASVKVEAVSHVLTVRNENHSVVTRRLIAQPSQPTPVFLESALEDSSFLPQSFNILQLGTLISKLGVEAPFFWVNRTSFEEETVNVICMLCHVTLPLSKVTLHTETKSHLLNMFLSLISRENEDYVNWCDATKSFCCLVCDAKFPRGRCSLQHFESSDHILKLQELRLKSEEVEENRRNSCPLSPAELKTLENMQKSMKLFCPFYIRTFLRLAVHVGYHINFFTFKRKEKLIIVCRLCKISLMDVDSAINHVKQSSHLRNAEKNKIEATVDAWIPSFCLENWKVLWADPHERVVYCTLCSKFLSNHIPNWVLHFESKVHNEKLRNFHSRLLTAATSC